MAIERNRPSPTSAVPDSGKAGAAVFSEADAWQTVGEGWKPLYGSFRGIGYSIEWHDFHAKEEFDWAASFHPGCLELCLNLSGSGYVESGGERAEFSPASVGFYYRNEKPLVARRTAGERHQFLTVEYSRPFLLKHLAGTEAQLHPLVRAVVEEKFNAVKPGAVGRLNSEQQQIVATLRHPPVYAMAQPVWYQCKALELAVSFFFQPPAEEELFCTRQHRQAQERVEQVMFLLKQNLAEPPALEDLGKRIGCSPFYLSRTFSSHTGQTITQYLRQLRMDRAAELLRSGEYNVTEAAMEVGYASPSHFSQAFHETFGCCPGLYPIATVAQKMTAARRKPGRSGGQ